MHYYRNPDDHPTVRDAARAREAARAEAALITARQGTAASAKDWQRVLNKRYPAPETVDA